MNIEWVIIKQVGCINPEEFVRFYGKRILSNRRANKYE